MIFLDTCIWIELLSVRTPTEPHEIIQAQAASELLNELLNAQETIVTCNEQLLELISAVEKVTMKTVNKMRKSNNQQGVGNLKEFRKLKEFQNTKLLCETIIKDVRHFAAIKNLGEYNMDAILQRMDIVDINDCLYYDYCIKEKIDFYTFDSDLSNLEKNSHLHIYNAQLQAWDIVI